jgi:6-phosphofructokinase 1
VKNRSSFAIKCHFLNYIYFRLVRQIFSFLLLFSYLEYSGIRTKFMKTLIVVSGGDAPGINTVIARYLRLATKNGDTVLGARGGFEGVLTDNIERIDPTTITLFAGRGGTYLASSRKPVLSEEGAKQQLLASLEKHEVDNILLFGGDGTLRHILPLLHAWGVPTIGLPTTIDNDVSGTDYTLGHDSACNFAFQAIEGVLATAHALTGRIFMVETLGGHTGYLALAVAYSSGAQIVLVPEYDVSLEWLGNRLKDTVNRDGYALVVLSEGVSFIPELAEAVPRLTGIRLRYTRLGHAQRGGDVTYYDRFVAHEMSRLSYDAFKQQVNIGTIIAQAGQLSLYEGTLSGEAKSPPNYNQYAFINEL